MLRNIWFLFSVILMMFTTPESMVYTRDRLLALRNKAVTLCPDDCAQVTQLRLRRRGCRAGSHKRRRWQAACNVTSLVIPGETPESINNNQLITCCRFTQRSGCAQPSTVSVATQVKVSGLPPQQCLASTCMSTFQPYESSPLSNVQEITRRGFQLTDGTLMTPISNTGGSVGDHHLVLSAVPVEDPWKTKSGGTTASASASTATAETQRKPSAETTIERPAIDVRPALPAVTSSPARQSRFDDNTPDEQLSDLSTVVLTQLQSPQSTVDLYDFYNSSPISILSLQSHPNVDDNTFSQSSPDVSTQSVASVVSDVASSQSHFKPKCKKKFQFPVFLIANIRGGLTTKLDELQLLLITNDVDICVISETWLHDGMNSDILQIADYSLFRLDRRGGQQGGGLAVYVKQGISCSYLSQLAPT